MNPADPFGLVGQVLDGQFRVDRLVGEGGFSVVYKGHHQGLNEPIAIKCLKLPSALGTSLVDSFVQRFRDESRILYRLSQGNLHVVRSIAAGTTQAPYTGALVPYMVLEWLDGRSLQNDLTVRRTIGSGGRSLADVVTLFAGAADALAYAHQQGVVHRDLNPGNIFLVATPQGTSAKVLDFGVAKIMHDSTLNLGPRAQTIGQIRIFAPAYGAPEQFDDRIGAVSAPSDVYSFALILLEALRDRPVNDAEHLGAFAQLAVDPNRRPTPHTLGMAVADEVEAVFARATRLDPRERWPVVGEFWQALTAAQKVATERRYRQAALATPSLPMGPVALPNVEVRPSAEGRASSASLPSTDPKRTMPLGSPGFAPFAQQAPRATPTPFPEAPGPMSAVVTGAGEPSKAPADPARDPRRTMMLAGGPPRMGAAPSPPEPKATAVDPPKAEPSLAQAGVNPSAVDPAVEAKRRLGSTFVMDHAATSQVHGAANVEGTPPPAQASTSQPFASTLHMHGPTPSPSVSQPFASTLHMHGPTPSPSVSQPYAPPQGATSQVYAGAAAAASSGAPSSVAEAALRSSPTVPPSPPPATSRGAAGRWVAALAVLAVLTVGAVGYHFFANRAADTGAASGAAASASAAPPNAGTAAPSPAASTSATASATPAASSAPSPVASAPAAPDVVAVAATAPAGPAAAPSPAATAKVSPEPSSSVPKAAATSTKTVTQAAPSAASSSANAAPNAFDETAARSRLSAANSVLVICKRAGGLSGAGSATVTFGESGTVSSVVIAPPFADTKEGSCAAGQFRRVKVQPFTGGPRTLAHAFDIPK